MLSYRYSRCTCFLEGSVFTQDENGYSEEEALSKDIRDVFFIPQEDYVIVSDPEIAERASQLRPYFGFDMGSRVNLPWRFTTTSSMR